MNNRVVSGLAGGIVCLAFAGPARAAASDADKAAAQALFDEARRLAAEQRWADACPKLAESQRLDPSMGTQFYLAECHERTGHLALAWTGYLEVADAARAAGLAERRRYARARAEALAPRLPRLTVKVDAAQAAGLTVTRDGETLGAAQWATAIPVDPGEHVIAATAPGKKPWTTTVKADEAAAIEVTVPALDVDDGPAVKDADAPPSRTTLRTTGFVTGAVGLVGLGIGAGLGVLAIHKKDESNAGGHCDAANTCDPIGKGLRRDSLRAATGSTVAFLAGGAAVVGGAVLLLVAPKLAPAASPKTAIAIGVGPGSLSLGGRW